MLFETCRNRVYAGLWEKDIIIAISEGLSNKEISKKLFISEGTIRNYITMILDKTDLEHRTAIAVNYLKGNL